MKIDVSAKPRHDKNKQFFEIFFVMNTIRYFLFFYGGIVMKKGLFLLIAVFFIAFGCTVETSENNEKDNNSEQGTLYHECYPNETCNKGLVCEQETNVCVREGASDDNKDGDTAPDGEENGTDGTDTASENEEGDNSDTASESDGFKESYNKSKYENHILFKGEGTLTNLDFENDPDLNKSDATGNFEIAIDGTTYKDFDKIMIYTYDTIILIGGSKILDKEKGIYFATSLYLMTSDLETIRDFADDLGFNGEIDFAPSAVVNKSRAIDEDLSCNKNLAVGMRSGNKSEAASANWYSDGRMQLFIDKNSTFAAGETFKIALDVSLSTDITDINNQGFAEYACYNGEGEIDCPEDIATLAGF
jgi:hypothetical protein